MLVKACLTKSLKYVHREKTPHVPFQKGVDTIISTVSKSSKQRTLLLDWGIFHFKTKLTLQVILCTGHSYFSGPVAFTKETPARTGPEWSGQSWDSRDLYFCRSGINGSSSPKETCESSDDQPEEKQVTGANYYESSVFFNADLLLFLYCAILLNKICSVFFCRQLNTNKNWNAPLSTDTRQK